MNRRIEVLVRLQPDDLQDANAAEPVLVSRSKFPVLEGLAIESRRNEFHDTGNPLSAIEALLVALKFNVYPPQSVLRWLERVLITWYEQEGTITMDEAMELGGNKTPLFKAALMQDRDEALMEEMHKLIFLGATREQAASMVARRMEESDWNKSRWDLDDLSAETLVKRHAAWKKKRNDYYFNESMGRIAADPDWVRSFLSAYDPLYMPPKLKSRA